MKPFSQTDKLILSVLLIVLVGITGWVVWPMFQGKQPTNTNTAVLQNENSNTANTNVANINTQPTNLNASVDTSNWKTYRNEELGFEVKYPDIVTVKEDIQTFTNPQGTASHKSVKVIFSDKNTGNSFGIYNAETGFEGETILETSTVLLDNHKVQKGVSRTIDATSRSTTITRYIFYPFNNNTPYESYWIYYPIDTPEEQNLFDAMVSTLKLF